MMEPFFHSSYVYSMIKAILLYNSWYLLNTYAPIHIICTLIAVHLRQHFDIFCNTTPNLAWLKKWYRPMTLEEILTSYDTLHGLVQVCSISIAKALEILQYCTKPLM